MICLKCHRPIKGGPAASIPQNGTTVYLCKPCLSGLLLAQMGVKS